MSESLALKHSIWLTKLESRIKKLEDIVAMNGSFQSMQDDIIAEHNKRIKQLEEDKDK